jgi:CheY-like chemotaxis protein
MRAGSYCVLVIDDDTNIRSLIRLLLESDGHKVLQAHDGAAGLAMADAWSPDLILLDLTMPICGGEEVYRELQRNPQTAHIPVIVFSAALSPDDMRMWQSFPSVVDVIAKPFDTYVLAARIEEVLAEQADEMIGV